MVFLNLNFLENNFFIFYQSKCAQYIYKYIV